MSKNGILLSVAEDQEGKSPRIVTEGNGLPVIAQSHLERAHETGILYKYSHWINNASTVTSDMMFKIILHEEV